MSTAKIQSKYYDRIVFVHVRQFAPLQVIENRESTERQYHLRERAIELGWPPSRVEVIDEDQGRSGCTPHTAPDSSAWRQTRSWARSGLWSCWRRRDWRATTAIGTGLSRSAESAAR